jgi:hypothetical protein
MKHLTVELRDKSYSDDVSNIDTVGIGYASVLIIIAQLVVRVAGSVPRKLGVYCTFR